MVKDNTIVDLDVHESRKNKGTKEAVKKAHLRHEHFKDCLESLKTYAVKQNIIKSRAHTISSYHITKIALTAFDTKRWIQNDNIHTLAYGHYTTLNNLI